jgi:hypothetical protein
MADGTPPERKVNPLVKAWVVFHMLMIVVWTLPEPTEEQLLAVEDPANAPARAQLVDVVQVANLRFKYNATGTSLPQYYMLGLGTFQYWDMFARNPSNVDVWFDSVVTLQSGKTVVHPYPRMKTMPIPQKYVYERYRKYTERFNNESWSWKWPHTAYRIGLEAWKDPSDPPVQVEMRRHFIEIPPYGQPIPKEYTTYSFYNLRLDTTQLTRMRDEGLAPLP